MDCACYHVNVEGTLPSPVRFLVLRNFPVHKWLVCDVSTIGLDNKIAKGDKNKIAKGGGCRPPLACKHNFCLSFSP